jgi:hypothetical protein
MQSVVGLADAFLFSKKYIILEKIDHSLEAAFTPMLISARVSQAFTILETVIVHRALDRDQSPAHVCYAPS